MDSFDFADGARDAMGFPSWFEIVSESRHWLSLVCMLFHQVFSH